VAIEVVIGAVIGSGFDKVPSFRVVSFSNVVACGVVSDFIVQSPLIGE